MVTKHRLKNGEQRMLLKRYFERHFSTILNMFPFWWFLKPSKKRGEPRKPTNPWGPLDFQDPYQVIQPPWRFSEVSATEVTYIASTKRSRLTIPNRSQRIAREKMTFLVIFTALGTWKPRFFLEKMPTVFKQTKIIHQNPRMPSPRLQELQHPHISSITDLMEEQKVS